MEGNYVKAQQEYKRGPKVLTLTDKGVAAAIIAGADLKQFDNYLKKRPTDSIAESLKYFESMATNPEKRSFMLQRAMDLVTLQYIVRLLQQVVRFSNY